VTPNQRGFSVCERNARQQQAGNSLVNGRIRTIAQPLQPENYVIIR